MSKLGRATGTDTNAPYGDDTETLKRIHAIYLNSIARQIAKGSDDHVDQFRKPLDTQAYRIASEYVADYFSQKLMTCTIDACQTETDGYIRNRHDHTWLARKLRFDETKPFMEQLLEAVVGDGQSTTQTATRSTTGKKHHPKASATGTLNDQQSTNQNKYCKKQRQNDFIESEDLSQFTGVMATGAGYNDVQSRGIKSEFATGMTFTNLSQTETQSEAPTETTYDPRGVKKVKKMPHLHKDKIQMKKSKYVGHMPQTDVPTEIDTILNTNDRMESRRQRREMRANGFITGQTETVEPSATFETADSYLEMQPRYVPVEEDPEWKELETLPESNEVLITKSPFAKKFPKREGEAPKLVALGLQTDRPGVSKYRQNAGVVPAPPLPSDLIDALKPPEPQKPPTSIQKSTTTSHTDSSISYEEEDYTEEEDDEMQSPEFSITGSQKVSVHAKPSSKSSSASKSTAAAKSSTKSKSSHHTKNTTQSNSTTDSYAKSTSRKASTKSGTYTEEEEEEDVDYTTTQTSIKASNSALQQPILQPKPDSHKSGNSSYEYEEEEEEEEETYDN